MGADADKDGGGMAKEPIAIEFDCQVRQVKSMADHSVNVILNLPEYCAEQAAALLKRIDDVGKVVIVFEPDNR
jgi:hypothetical protein